MGQWWVRLRVQIIALVAFNGYYWAPQGKYLCLPVLNCYACPVGTVACPVGSLTAFSIARMVPYYIVGFLLLAGMSVGRGFCGWACPFGLLQDALYKIRSRKLRLHKALNLVKYALLIVLVIGIPYYLGAGASASATDRITKESAGAVDYCALVCPAGTLEAGLPALARDSAARANMGWRSWNKLAILAVVLGLMVVANRSFCRVLCPIGAMMAATSRFSLFGLKTDQGKCTRCMRCVRVCPTASREVPQAAGGKEATAECVMCLDCVRECPEKEALAAHFGRRVVSLSDKEIRPAKDLSVQGVSDGA